MAWPPMRPRHTKNYDKLLSEEVHQAPGPEHGARWQYLQGNLLTQQM